MENRGRGRSAGEAPTSSSIQINAQDMNIVKLLECPVCFEVMTPPITLCTGGHAICNECRKSVRFCPTCRGQFTQMRCRFAENLLDSCMVRCRYHEAGCRAKVPGGELTRHLNNCDFRPITCLGCNKEIPHDKFLTHLHNEEKVAVQMVQECRSRFENIKREDNLLKWRSIWIRAHNKNFFCFLDTVISSFSHFWIVWVGYFGTLEDCRNYVGSITIFNKEQNIEMKFVGKIHPIRMPKKDVMEGGHCLLLLDAQINRFLKNDGIDVIFRVDRDVTAPQSPLGTSTPDLDWRRRILGLTEEVTETVPNRTRNAYDSSFHALGFVRGNEWMGRTVSNNNNNSRPATVTATTDCLQYT